MNVKSFLRIANWFRKCKLFRDILNWSGMLDDYVKRSETKPTVQEDSWIIIACPIPENMFDSKQTTLWSLFTRKESPLSVLWSDFVLSSVGNDVLAATNLIFLSALKMAWSRWKSL